MDNADGSTPAPNQIGPEFVVLEGAECRASVKKGLVHKQDGQLPEQLFDLVVERWDCEGALYEEGRISGLSVDDMETIGKSLLHIAGWDTLEEELGDAPHSEEFEP